MIAKLSEPGDERLTVKDIMTILGDRIYALLIVVFGLPNCLPMPPPIPFICGVLLGFVAIQLAIGKQTPWFPKVLLVRSVKRQDVIKVAERAIPLFKKLERYSKPRLMFFVEPIAHRVIGILVLLLAIAFLFAPPFIGQVPLGFAVCLIGLGLVERDGVIVFIGVALGALGASISFSFAYAVFAGLESLF